MDYQLVDLTPQPIVHHPKHQNNFDEGEECREQSEYDVVKINVLKPVL